MRPKHDQINFKISNMRLAQNLHRVPQYPKSDYNKILWQQYDSSNKKKNTQINRKVSTKCNTTLSTASLIANIPTNKVLILQAYNSKADNLVSVMNKMWGLK